ncbi:MAG: FeoA family protein [Chloroflexota bacterium]|nr:FeoA family protein [Chloroflexota bacterium]
MAEVRRLSELKPGERGKVVKVGGSGAIHRRILDMGVVPGSEIEVERVAPLADPVEFKLLGYHLSLRKEEAQNVQVELR